MKQGKPEAEIVSKTWEDFKGKFDDLINSKVSSVSRALREYEDINLEPDYDSKEWGVFKDKFNNLNEAIKKLKDKEWKAFEEGFKILSNKNKKVELKYELKKWESIKEKIDSLFFIFHQNNSIASKNDVLIEEIIPEMQGNIREFLNKSRLRGSWFSISDELLGITKRFIGRHLTFSFGVLFLSLLFWKVKAVNALFWNEGWWIILHVSLSFLPALILGLKIRPIKFLNLLYKSKGSPKNIKNTEFATAGEEAFADYSCIQPERVFMRWERNSVIHKEMRRGQVSKFGFSIYASLLYMFITWWGYYLFDRQYPTTIIIILFCSTLFLLVADQIDFWNFISRYPFRFAYFLMFIIIFYIEIKYRERWGFIAGSAFALFLFLRYFKTEKLKLWPKPPHSIYWAAISLIILILNICFKYNDNDPIWSNDFVNKGFSRLKDQFPFPKKGEEPIVVLTASGGGSRAAIYTAKTLEELNNGECEDDKAISCIGRQLQVISSVSGGSLATTAYIARLARAGEDAKEDEYWAKRKEKLSKYVESMKGDFLLPTLVGSFWPPYNRAECLEKEWANNGCVWNPLSKNDEPVGLENITLGSLATAWEDFNNSTKDWNAENLYPPFPMPLINTTTLDGHYLVISPLAKQHYVDIARHDEANIFNRYSRIKGEEKAWVYYRNGIYGLEDIIGNQDIELTKAVRASASFPYGFPSVEVRLSEGKKQFFSPYNKENLKKSETRIFLTDGGVLSNSGMWSMYQLLKNYASEFKKRGVLLIMVDASGMPFHKKEDHKGLLETYIDQDAIGRNLHEKMLDSLKSLYGENRFAAVDIYLIPKAEYNIMTTWFLDKNSLKALKTSFDCVWAIQKPNIINKWEALKNKKALKGRDYSINEKSLIKEFCMGNEEKERNIGIIDKDYFKNMKLDHTFIERSRIPLD